MNVEQFEVDFGCEVGKRSFQDLKEFGNWLEGEKNFWKWIHGITLPNPFGSLRGAYAHNLRSQNDLASSHYTNIFNSLSSALQEAERQRNEAALKKLEFDPASHIAMVQRNVRESYVKQTTLISNGPRAAYVMRLREKDPLIALYALAYFCRLNLTYVDYQGQEGSILASQFENGITNQAPAYSESLDKFRTDWQNTFEDFKSRLQSQSAIHSDLNNKASMLIEEQTAGISKLLDSHRDEWTSLKKIFNEELAIQSPVRYWTERAQRHFCGEVGFGISSLLAGGAVFYILFYEINELLGKIPVAKAVQSASPVETLKSEYWRLAMLILIGSLGIWFVRILVRLFFNHVHLHNDAMERVTMVRTYLALLRRGKGLRDEDRQLILQALFRPAASASVKEPSIPMQSLETLSRPKP
ncbi:MAG: DUF6161 domain-containing protein [Verrucomicrobiia bacterium]